LSADPQWPGSEAPREEAWGLVATTGDATGPVLALSGHIDVVPAGDLTQWTSDPFTPAMRDGAVVGRGACDMKGGLIAAAAAVAAVAAVGVRLKGKLALHSVVSEEDGGLGTLATIRRGHRADTCVIPEPTGGQVITANAGALGFRLTVSGRSVHGALREAGVSAVDAFLPVYAALRELERSRNAAPDPRFGGLALPYALSVGKLAAGDWASTVPDRLVAEGRYGVQIGEPVPEARAAFEACVRAACAGDAWLAGHPIAVGSVRERFAAHRAPAARRRPGRRQGRQRRAAFRGGGPVRKRFATLRRRRHPDRPLWTGRPAVGARPGRARSRRRRRRGRSGAGLARGPDVRC
jgi:acetylornithine deacetylase